MSTARPRHNALPVDRLAAASERRKNRYLERVEATAWASDRAFFERNPQRRYRVRPAFDAEIEDAARHDVALAHTPPEGMCWWVAVRQLHPAGVRVRWLFAAARDLPADPPEAAAHQSWASVCSPDWERTIKELERDLATARVLADAKLGADAGGRA